MQRPNKHHFLPAFFLSRWCDETNRVTEFRKPYLDAVKPKKSHPNATGFIPRLYAVEGLSKEVSVEIESEFLSPVDSRAAEALDKLYTGASLNIAERKAWSQFLATMIMRMPQDIEALKSLVNRLHTSTFDKLTKMMQRHLPVSAHTELIKGHSIIQDEIVDRKVRMIMKWLSSMRTTSFLNEMHYSVITVDGAKHELLTSDSPVLISSNDFADSGNVIMMPIGPKTIYVSATNNSTLDLINRIPHERIAKEVNEQVVSRARKYVFGKSNQSLRFIQNRMTKNKSQSPMEHALARCEKILISFEDAFDAFTDEDAQNEFNKLLEEHDDFPRPTKN